MSEIPDADLKAIAEELLETTDAPHGLPTYSWRYTDETGRRVVLPVEETGESTGEESAEPAMAAVDFEDGPSARFTYQGTEFEAAWRRWYRIVAYRPVPDPGGEAAEG